MLILQKISSDVAALETVRQLFLEYADELQENLCFQSFDAEVKDPLKKYGPPKGALFIAYWNEAPAGCIALQPLKEEGVCEMKRLYVKPAFRKYGIGRSLVEQLITESYQLGYAEMRLDTLERLKPAISLYKSLGFENTQAYNENPLSGVVYMEKKVQ